MSGAAKRQILPGERPILPDAAHRAAVTSVPVLVLGGATASALADALRASGAQIAEGLQSAQAIILVDGATPPEGGADRPTLVLGSAHERARAQAILPMPARIEEILTWLGANHGARVVPIGPHRLRPRERMLETAKGALRLTEREVLLLLALADGRILDREGLLHEVWGVRPDTDTQGPNAAVYRLRRKLAERGLPPLIQSTPQGYRLA